MPERRLAPSTKRKRSEVMSRIRGRGNKDTEIALARLLRANGISGWRRQGIVRLAVRGSGFEVHRSAGYARRTGHLALQNKERRGAAVRVDFVFRKERLAVFVDGCFWHGCPKHSSPAKWLRKSSMKGRISHHEGTKSTKAAGRTGKAFWAGKMAGNIARDRFVTRALRREGWRVVRIWEHEMGAGRSQESEDRRQKVVGRIREAVGAVRGGTD